MSSRAPVAGSLLAAAAVLGLLVTATGPTTPPASPTTTSSAVVRLADDDDGSSGNNDGGNDDGGKDSNKDDSSSKSGLDSGSSSKKDSGSDDGKSDSKKSGDKSSGDKSGSKDDSKDSKDSEEEFPGRDKIGKAGADEYVDDASITPNQQVGEGGEFSGGSYSFDCPLSDHHNSDNPILAPGKRNGAQHTHDYAGNDSTNATSDVDSLQGATSTCTNGDKSPIFWPVLRNLAGVGPDVGQDGGSLDGNVGSFIEPTAVDYTFHGHGSARVQPMPPNMTLVTGSAKAASTGKGANAKYSCSATPSRVTDKYPICPAGSRTQRLFDFPSCWNGKDLDSKDHLQHLTYPDQSGNCPSDRVPVPALRITVSYDQLQPQGFSIDSFPEEQHNPSTDHALLEYLASDARAQAGAQCINTAQRCAQGADQDTSRAGPQGASDQVPAARNFANAMNDMGSWGQDPTTTSTSDSSGGSGGGAGSMAGMGH